MFELFDDRWFIYFSKFVYRSCIQSWALTLYMGIGLSKDHICGIQIKPFDDTNNIMSLINEIWMRRVVLMNLEAHVVVHGIVCYLEHGRELLNDNVNIAFINGANNVVMHKNINDEINFVSISYAIIYATITVLGNEIIQLRKNIKCMIAKSASLFKSKKHLRSWYTCWGYLRFINPSCWCMKITVIRSLFRWIIPMLNCFICIRSISIITNMTWTELCLITRLKVSV